jgi:hypothetical protein
LSLTRREKHRLKMFDSRVLRNMLEPKRDEVRREIRRLQNEELYVTYSSPNIIRAI